jgi:predicted nucleic acid-binding protein
MVVEALEDLVDLSIVRYSHGPLLHRMWVLGDNCSAYDAAYVALAEEFGASLLTLDVRLARAVGHRATIEVVGT